MCDCGLGLQVRLQAAERNVDDWETVWVQDNGLPLALEHGNAVPDRVDEEVHVGLVFTLGEYCRAATETSWWEAGIVKLRIFE